MVSTNPGRVSDHHKINVKGGRLSQFISKAVDLLKLDVEGAEFEVLEDLVLSGKIALVQSMMIEYHHKISNSPSRLASFLETLETQGYEYQIAAAGCNPILGSGECQDIVIGAFRPAAVSAQLTPAT
jgi:hypothetical protein